MVPVLGGETDILKVAQLMPGISQGGEGTTGLFVRGGTADQNLILLDEAVVYNTGHLFGFFSVFNPDAIRDMTIIKGGFPAQYGGRLSSVLDIRMKEGNKEKFHFKGGIGLLSSRLHVEGPIVRDKLSFSIAGRRTYIDQIFRTVGVKIPYYFYDINAKLNYKISDKDRIFFSSYFGDDVLKVNGESGGGDDADSTDTELFNFGFRLGNFTQTLRWNHLFNDRLFANFTALHTFFKYNINGAFVNNSLLIKSQIRDLGTKADFDYFVRPGTHLKFGGGVVWHGFRPNVVATEGQITEFLSSQKGTQLNSQEMSVYGGADHEISTRLKVNVGLRLSGTTVKNAFYPGVEPRLSGRYTLTENSSLKAGYSRMYQYMHRVSSSTVALPTDLWYPVTSQVRPQNADQLAIGYHQFIPGIKLGITVETYYKRMRNLIEYREGANLVLNDEFEDELVTGSGDSYGFEFLFRRKRGRLTGWVGYTLSWARRDFADLNYGKPYWAKYDRRHDVSVVGIFEITPRISFSGVFIYQSGRRFTAQLAQYFMPNASLTGVDIIPIYSDRNAIKMPSTHRLDLNMVFKSKPLNKKGEPRRFKTEWHLGAYNVYNRASPYRINIVAEGAGYKYQTPGLFGFLPFFAYNFEF
ncbi:MAG TPA: TonB-dependent receptor [Bacteroidetes bacterium]|nr:TonB-dependent receptor [Bacteroidota bacterium]